MKTISILTSLLLILLFGCSDKPEAPPNNTQLSVYPNPASTSFNITIHNSAGSPYSIGVYNTRGDITFYQEDNQDMPTYIIDISNSPKGTYEVILKINNEKFIQRLLKI